MGWRQVSVTAALIIVYGTGKNTGLFVYNGTPAHGNPPIFWATSATSDPFGNSIPSTAGVAGTGTFQAGDTIINPNGEFVYSTTPASGKLIASIVPTGGLLDPFGDTTLEGFTSYATTGQVVNVVNEFITLGPLSDATERGALAYVGAGISCLTSPLVTDLDTRLGVSLYAKAAGQSGNSFGQVVIGAAGSGISGPSPSSTAQLELQSGTGTGDGLGLVNNGGSIAVLKQNANGNPEAVLPSTLTGALPAVQTDTSTNTNANNGTQLLSVNWTIPANDAQVGTVYLIEVPFNGTFETATLGFKPNLSGVTETTSGGDVLNSGFFSGGTGFAGTVRLKMQVLTTGTGGTVNLFIEGSLGFNGQRAAGNYVNVNSQATAVTFNTTISNTLSVNSVWGASVASQTITGRGSTFTRMGP